MRTFSQKVNDILTSGYAENNEPGIMLFTSKYATEDKQYEFPDDTRFDVESYQAYQARVQSLMAGGMSETDAKAAAVLTVTSTEDSYYQMTALNFDVLAAMEIDPGRLANMHYFNPALVMKLVEVVQGEHVSPETADALLEFCRATGKKPILIRKEIDGFVVNRILASIYNEAHFLVEAGYCTPQEIDIACENGLNHPMGPYRLNDLTGIDLSYDIMSRAYAETGVKPRGYDIIKELYSKGYYGKKSGHGFYDYTE